MILQALYEYYQRKAEELPPEGFAYKGIPFLIVLTKLGDFSDLQDTRESQGKKPVAKSFLVPKEHERSGKNAWQRPNLLWDHYGYVLGHPKSDNASDKEMAAKQHRAFVGEIKRLHKANPSAVALQAVLSFLETGNFKKVFDHRSWADCRKIPGCNLSFRISEDSQLVCQGESIKSHIASKILDNEDEGDTENAPQVEAMCLITGELCSIARLHRRTPIQGSKSTARLVSFQKGKGFDSYGKQQSYNAPVGRKTSTAYTTALNHLLGKDSRQRMQVGDASTVFWAERTVSLENDFDAFFGELSKDDPDRLAQAVKRLYESVHSGTSHVDEANDTRFYVLGLAPNAARIAVRFWHVATVRELGEKLRLHFDDTKIDHAPLEPDSLPLNAFLSATANETKFDNKKPNLVYYRGKYYGVKPNLVGETMRSVLSGDAYPNTLIQAVLNRIRAEQAKKNKKGEPINNIGYPRAALLKAWLNRHTRQSQPYEKEITVSLDKNNTNIGYRLGCLFAALERIQEDASSRKLNSTIRDRFYGTASSTPIVVFAALMRLNQHHMSVLRKDKPGLFVERNKLLSQIINNGLDGKIGFPPTLRLQDQGRFAIGYYHQRQDFFKPNQGE